MYSNEQALILSPDFHPDCDDLLSQNGLTAFGMPGSGKSGLLSLLVEQMTRFHLPQIIFDTEGEALSLLSVFPRGRVMDRHRPVTGQEILHKGLQVIVNLKSWEEEYDQAALAICKLIDSLFAASGAQKPDDRVPCVLLLDEAAFWLPRRSKRINYLDKDIRAQLLSTFERVGSRGRKYGLIGCYFTQFASQIETDVIRLSGCYVLMRQTAPIDLERYADYTAMNAALKERVRSFLPGEAIVLFAGQQILTRFHAQTTLHASQTPKVHRAIAKFASAGQPETCEHWYTIPEVCEMVSRSRNVVYQQINICGIEIRCESEEERRTHNRKNAASVISGRDVETLRVAIAASAAKRAVSTRQTVE